MRVGGVIKPSPGPTGMVGLTMTTGSPAFAARSASRSARYFERQ